MAFGLSAAQVAMIGVGAGALAGGQSGSNSATQSTQNQIDPRLVPFLYGDGGLLGGVNNLYQQQAAQGGLNPMQTAGLEMQRQTLMNPAYTQGFDQMRSLGSGLMGQGVAGNPFTGGQTAFGSMPSLMGQMGHRTLPQTPDRRSALFSALGFPASDPLAAAYQPIQQASAAPQMTPKPATPAVDPMQQQYGASMPYFGYRPGDQIGGIA